MPPQRNTGSPLNDILTRLRVVEQRVENAHPENAGQMFERMQELERLCREHVNGTLAALKSKGEAVNNAFRVMESKCGAIGKDTEDAQQKLEDLLQRSRELSTSVDKKLEAWQAQTSEMQKDVARAKRIVEASQEQLTKFTNDMRSLELSMKTNLESAAEQFETTEAMLNQMQKKLSESACDDPFEWERLQKHLVAKAKDQLAPVDAIPRAQKLARSRSQSRDPPKGTADGELKLLPEDDAHATNTEKQQNPMYVITGR
jgi:chromosome segregation ATPase